MRARTGWPVVLAVAIAGCSSSATKPPVSEGPPGPAMVAQPSAWPTTTTSIRTQGPTSTMSPLARAVAAAPAASIRVGVRSPVGFLVNGAPVLTATLLQGRPGAPRSGLGVDGSGQLLYAAGPGLDAFSLAQVLVQAGAIRALELDINPAFVGFAFYTPSSAGTDLVPGMAYQPSHWLSGSSRDFIAIFVR